jgi:lipoate-protein ligase A
MKRSKPLFRLILSGPGAPARNMAVDRVLFQGVLDGGMPFLRFYTWDPPGLSLGRFQRDMAGLDLDHCRGMGITVVRRLTGGRAVLHHRELTYSVGAPFHGPFASAGAVKTCSLVAEALCGGFRRLGVSVDAAAGRAPGGGQSPNCFAAPSRFEITWRGRKLVGSAQRRERKGFLQHGSIILGLDRALWGGVFPSPDTLARAVSLEEITGRSHSADELVAAFSAAWAAVLSIELRESTLSAPEEEAVAAVDESPPLL